MNIERGQGFVAKGLDGAGLPFLGLVLQADDEKVTYVRVVPEEDPRPGSSLRLRSFDDPDAVEERDKDNVRLLTCPKPFSELDPGFARAHGGKSPIIALAFVDRPLEMSRAAFDQLAPDLSDDGVKIDAFDMARVENHPWETRTQYERALSDLSEMNRDDDASRKRLQAVPAKPVPEKVPAKPIDRMALLRKSGVDRMGYSGVGDGHDGHDGLGD